MVSLRLKSLAEAFKIHRRFGTLYTTSEYPYFLILLNANKVSISVSCKELVFTWAEATENSSVQESIFKPLSLSAEGHGGDLKKIC